jgi:hypothetical protein
LRDGIPAYLESVDWGRRLELGRSRSLPLKIREREQTLDSDSTRIDLKVVRWRHLGVKQKSEVMPRFLNGRHAEAGRRGQLPSGGVRTVLHTISIPGLRTVVSIFEWKSDSRFYALNFARF